MRLQKKRQCARPMVCTPESTPSHPLPSACCHMLEPSTGKSPEPLLPPPVEASSPPKPLAKTLRHPPQPLRRLLSFSTALSQALAWSPSSDDHWNMVWSGSSLPPQSCSCPCTGNFWAPTDGVKAVRKALSDETLEKSIEWAKECGSGDEIPDLKSAKQSSSRPLSRDLKRNLVCARRGACSSILVIRSLSNPTPACSSLITISFGSFLLQAQQAHAGILKSGHLPAMPTSPPSSSPSTPTTSAFPMPPSSSAPSLTPTPSSSPPSSPPLLAPASSPPRSPSSLVCSR